MSPLTPDQQSFLQAHYRHRVSFQERERKLYGHDMATMPAVFKPLIRNTVPDAVVQPETEDELVQLVHWAAENRVPLTPRGKATSGYGGVLPVKRGIVVDFYHMSRLLDVDAGAQTVTVQPGMVWEKLDRLLAKHALTLRLYPTSYPSSTVGGWLAQGGAGIGSFESGWFVDNVVSARVVMPDSSVRVFAGPDLQVVSEAEGTTGLISAITLQVRPLEEMRVLSFAVRTPTDLQWVLQVLIGLELPIWSVLFINPKMAELRNESPLREHRGHPVEQRQVLPKAYIVTLAYRARDAETIEARAATLIQAVGGQRLDDAIAEHEWENRFKLMIVKRLGPSLVPAEIVLPLKHLGAALNELEQKINQPLVKEGIVIREGRNGEPEAVILGFIPSDERKLSYTFVFGLSLSVLKIAAKHGGGAYSTGLYFSNKASQVLGEKRLAWLKEFKANVDPDNLMNPGKVFGGGLMPKFIGLASIFEPLVRPLGNAMTVKVGERVPARPVKGLPADLAWYAYACAQCGYCVDECPQFYGRGWESQSPRGKWYWLREYIEGREKWDQLQTDTFLQCTTCEMCDTRCSASLPIESSWLKLRGRMVDEEERMTLPAFEMMGAALHDEGDIWAGYRRDRAKWFPADLDAKHGPGVESCNVYFAGCTASYVENDIGMASARLLDAAGVDYMYLGEEESCCGTPMLVAGKWDLFAETLRRNLVAVEAAGADTVICSCPACDMMWRQIYPDWAKKLGLKYNIKTKHYTELIAERMRAGEFTFPANGHAKTTVTWHDSCHLGRASGVYEPPRELIRAIPGTEFVEMEHHHAQAHCCGSVLTLIKEPPVANALGGMRLQEALDAGAEKVLSLCPCCQFQLRVSAEKNKMPVEIVDLARYAASALGFDFPDPNPQVQQQWAVFEAMIRLMTPKGFADLMGTLRPELIDAMPLGIGRMMRWMGRRMPSALGAMRPLFPVLIPALLPMMMPKLMPTLLARVGDQIPLPDYMQEQMPDLMPRVMDNLMPHMLREVVPLVTQPMIDYLRTP